jgi:hypothetical protein
MSEKHYTGSEKVCFAGYTFDAHKGAIACSHVLEGKPILGFVHRHDGELDFLCGAPSHTDEEVKWLCVHHIVDEHPELATLPVVDFGMEAWRESCNQSWMVAAFVEE